MTIAARVWRHRRREEEAVGTPLRRAGLSLALTLAMVVAGATSVWADPQTPAASASGESSQKQLNEIEKQLEGSEQQQRKMQTDIEAIRADRVRLTAALLAATARTRADEDHAREVEGRLETARASEAAIRQSLLRRKSLIAKVLAVLQRMSRKPPPAVLVDPRDMLSAIRTSMLLGSVVPQMRQEVEALASDLADLSRARQAVSAEKSALASDVSKLEEQRRRLTADIAARQAAQAKEQNILAGETAHAQELARKASNLKDLISRMTHDQEQRMAALPAAPGRLAPSRPFAQLRGALELPVSGALVKRYGDPGEFGGTETGESFAALPGAVVTAPADSWVAYSGAYRTYGQLLILNAGGGYYVVMAGMDRINVEVGQFVVAGEPVAMMGDGSTKTAAAIAIGAAQPVLYVEFRKDGATIDPGPWWAKPEIEKARG